MRINYGTWLGVCGQLICMQITATNLCVWVQTVVFETVEDIESQETRMIVEQWLKVNFTGVCFYFPSRTLLLMSRKLNEQLLKLKHFFIVYILFVSSSSDRNTETGIST